MRVRIISNDNMAVLFDSVTETAFGPVIRPDEAHGDAEETASAFIEWATERTTDLRYLMPALLRDLYERFQTLSGEWEPPTGTRYADAGESPDPGWMNP